MQKVLEESFSLGSSFEKIDTGCSLIPTRREKELFELLKKLEVKRTSLTHEGLGQILDITPGTVRQLLRGLRKKGFTTNRARKRKSDRVLNDLERLSFILYSSDYCFINGLLVNLIVFDDDRLLIQANEGAIHYELCSEELSISLEPSKKGSPDRYIVETKAGELHVLQMLVSRSLVGT